MLSNSEFSSLTISSRSSSLPAKNSVFEVPHLEAVAKFSAQASDNPINPDGEEERLQGITLLDSAGGMEGGGFREKYTGMA